MLDKFAEELREARTKSGISLVQMSNKTKIDIKFLEALDKGDFAFLPEPYVKAFLKDYARIVGLDEEKTISKYEAAKKGKEIDDEIKTSQTVAKPVSGGKTYDAAPATPPQQSFDKYNLKVLLFWGGAAAVIIFLLVYLIFLRSPDVIVVEEKPFEEIISESRERFIENHTDQDLPAVSVSDSILLSIFASDTSWVKIILDDKKTDEFILFPNSQKQMKAQKDYKITLGNSGSIRFRLNDEPLNFAGRPGAVQHVQIDKDGLKFLQSPPTLPQGIDERN
jgi:cytoskeleton protein RodZ